MKLKRTVQSIAWVVMARRYCGEIAKPLRASRVQILLSIAAVACAVGHVRAEPYVFTALDTLGGSASSASGINSSGQVVGSSYTSGDSTIRATLWNGTTATDLGTLGGESSWAYGINDAGQVVGTSITSDRRLRATLWNGATATDLGTLGGQASWGHAINASGQVAGRSTNSDHVGFATLWNGTTPANLGSFNGLESYATGINASGQVVGYSHTDTGVHAALWDGSVITDLGTLGGTRSFALDINDSGLAVGYSYTSGDSTIRATLWNGTTAIDLGAVGGGNSYAWGINSAGQVVGQSDFIGANGYVVAATLWNGTTAIDLNSFLSAADVSAGWILTSANAINDKGWIAGTATNTFFPEVMQAYLLSPVPEPEAYSLALAGVSVLGVLTIWRRRGHSSMLRSPRPASDGSCPSRRRR
jgi:probable HAF family extracellular repeat protein